MLMKNRIMKIALLSLLLTGIAACQRDTEVIDQQARTTADLARNVQAIQ